MNRTERRKALKSINTPQKFTDAVSLALKKQREDMLNDFAKQKKEFVDIILTMTAYTIQYKLGLGKKRLPEIISAIYDNIDAFNTGHLSKDDYETIKKEIQKYNIII